VSLVRPETEGYGCEFGSVPLPEVANSERRLPPSFLAEGGLTVTAEYGAYAVPLLGPAPAPHFRLG